MGTASAALSGRGAVTEATRADVCWVPIASGLAPHGLRHTYKTLMIGFVLRPG